MRVRIRRPATSALWVILAITGLASCGTTDGSQSATQAQSGPAPVVIPLQVRWSELGARPMIYVRVGNGPRVPVLLDTGSTGLHIYSGAVRLGARSGVAVTARRDTATYADGMVQRGVVAHATLTIGSFKTTRAVPIGLIDHVSCVAEIPDCPGAAGIDRLSGDPSMGLDYGILGVSLTRTPEGLANPLLSLPSPYSRDWSIELTESGGSLILGPHQIAGPVAHFRLAPDGRDPSGARAWKDTRAKVCWATVDLRGAACEPTAFDSGSVTMLWYGGLLSRSDTSIDDVLVNPGEYIVAWQPGTQDPFWRFVSGTDLSHNSVVALRGGHPVVIAAVQVFLAFDVEYNDAAGQIAIYRQTAP